MSQLELGSLLKSAGMSTAIAAADQDYRARFDAYLEFLARSGREFTSEDVCGSIGRPPGSGNLVGALLSAAAKRGLIEKVGWDTAKRPGMHGTDLRLWKGRAA